MLHFLGFFQFIIAVIGNIDSLCVLISLIVFALSLALHFDDDGFSGWPMAIILLLIAVSLITKQKLILLGNFVHGDHYPGAWFIYGVNTSNRRGCFPTFRWLCL